MTETVTRTLASTGATITYDVRGAAAGSEARPALLLIGSPMDATGFTTLASHFPDRTVVTYDPRGAGRSVRTDGVAEHLPVEHAEDLRRVIEAVGLGPVEIFASSGGAVNALALVAAHPELVSTLVAHEPPVVPVLPDAEVVGALCTDIHATYLRAGSGRAMAKFFEALGVRGEFPADWLSRPAPDPAAFGLPAEDDGTRGDPLLGQNMRGCTGYRPDAEALRAAGTRIVPAVGKESEGQFPARAAVALAGELGREPAVFPGDHGGFLGGEYGQHGEPEAFAQTLRAVLDQA
ncbi:alpha/beta hydrolase [Streptomyces sp. NPDC089919]|uniref:alpha/beta fold hydrolase n=1 Tax=Streptomyces sp. NPDC089919 TaxID=3155188 RepID=UPI0034421437